MSEKFGINSMGKAEYVELYVNVTLQEIKKNVRKKINLKPEQEVVADDKIKGILIDLINSNFSNIKEEVGDDSFYKLLPLTDEQENKKIRCILVLLYTALYFENVVLLNKLLKEEVSFGNQPHDLLLCLLDKDISSAFVEDIYIEVVKSCKNVFSMFYSSTKDLDEIEREKYIGRFVSILKVRYKDFEETPQSSFHSLFSKITMDILEDKTYLLASKEQLYRFEDISCFNIRGKDSVKRLNNLIQNSDFCQKYWNYDLMFKLFNDEELFDKDYWVCHFFERFSDSKEMLDKAMDLYNRCPVFATSPYSHCSAEVLRDISNDVLIELNDKIDLRGNSEYIKLVSKRVKTKLLIKKFFNGNNK